MKKKQRNDKTKRSWYYHNLQNFIDFVGEPIGNIVRDNLPLALSIIYVLCGILIKIFPDNIVLRTLGYVDYRWNYLIIGCLELGGTFMLFYWLVLANKICWRKQGKEVTAEECWWWLKRIFVFLLPFIWVKKLILYILREGRQEKIVRYIPEMLLSFLLTLILFPLEIKFVKRVVAIFENIIGKDLTDEFIVLIIVVLFIGTFFWGCRKSIHLSIWVSEIEPKLRKLKKINQVNRLDSKDINEKENEIKKEYQNLKEEADQELRYSELYFYVVMNIILLSLHFEDANTYEKLFANEFMGVTTLAALLREVEAKKSKNCI